MMYANLQLQIMSNAYDEASIMKGGLTDRHGCVVVVFDFDKNQRVRTGFGWCPDTFGDRVLKPHERGRAARVIFYELRDMFCICKGFRDYNEMVGKKVRPFQSIILLMFTQARSRIHLLFL